MLNAQWHEARLFRAAPRNAIAQDIADALRRHIVRLVDRMKPSLLARAERQAGAELSELHEALAEAVSEGRPLSAGRLARVVARREVAALDEALG